MDPVDAKSFRPISNLSVLSKLLERLVSKQLVKYLTEVFGLLPDRQFAYRRFHSTETAVLRVLSDILLALDSSDLAMLTLLDLSAVFDSVDHNTLLTRCRSCTVLMGLTFHGSPHTWLSACSLLNHQHLVQRRQWFYMECHRFRSSDQSFSSYTLLTSCNW